MIANFILPTTGSAAWSEIRTGGSTTPGIWQYVTCTGGYGSGWQSCEPDLTIFLVATPPNLPATGAQTTILATVTDYYGNSVGSSLKLNWQTTDGSLSAGQTLTDSEGHTSVTLKSSAVIGGATVTATPASYGGTGSIFVPFEDLWNPIASHYTDWVAYGAPYDCSPWSPDPSTVASGTEFTQTSVCTLQYQSYRQDREQSAVTGTIRNVGGPIAQYTTAQVIQNQQAVGTQPPPAPSGACVELYDGEEYFTKNGRGTFMEPDARNGHISYQASGRFSFIYSGSMPVMGLKEISRGMGDDQKVNRLLESYRTNPDYWIHGNDGGIYYPYKVHSTSSGADTDYWYWWYSGVCVIQRPTN
ncbi:Ig-like domain-containing protein [Pseudomonas putida]|uniref:Ig-like domain-containing protein n=1 Tax=Pseudomonas fulva TaxID=47880 RepID=UPI0015EE9F3D